MGGPKKSLAVVIFSLARREAWEPGFGIRACWWGTAAHRFHGGCALLWGVGKGRLGRGQQVGRGWREEAGEGGGGPELAWRIEVGPSSPRRSGGGLIGGGSILSLALSLCLPIRFLSLGSTRIPGTENEALAYASPLKEGGGGEVKFPH